MITNPNLTIVEIAEFVGIVSRGLKNVLYDIKKNRILKKEEIETFLRKGKKIEWIAEYYGVTYLPLKRFMMDNGLNSQVVLEEKRIAKSQFPNLKNINIETIHSMSAYELNPQYTKDTDAIMTDLNEWRNYKKAENERLRVQKRFFRNIDALESEECCRNRYNAEYEIYKRSQYGIATKDNFYFNTMAKFTEVTRPSRDPDYVVDRKNKKDRVLYWFTRNGVIRGTRYWGPWCVGTCEWMVKLTDGTDYWGTWDSERLPNRMIFGKAKWEDFVYKTTMIEFEPQRICGFNNMSYGGINQFQGKNIILPIAHTEDYYYRLQLMS